MSRFVYIGNIFILRYKADSNIQNTYIFFSMVQHRCSKTAQHIPYCLLTHRCHAATNTHITQCNSSNKYSNMVGKGMCGGCPPPSLVWWCLETHQVDSVAPPGLTIKPRSEPTLNHMLWCHCCGVDVLFWSRCCYMAVFRVKLVSLLNLWHFQNS